VAALVNCASCGAPIVWAKTKTGKRQPFDADATDATGTWGIENGEAVYLGRGVHRGYIPHHATCPQGSSWRRAR